MAWHAPRTLLWRLGLALIVAQLIVAVALGTYAFHRVREFHYDQTQQELGRATPLIVAGYAGRLNASDEAALDADIKQRGAESGLRITIMRPDGRVIADSDAIPDEMDDHRFRPEISEAVERGSGTSVRYSATLGVPLMYYAQRLTDEKGDLLGVIRTALPMRRIDADYRHIVQIIGLAGLLSMLLTFAVIILVSRHYSRQVRDLADGAARFASGEFDYRITQPATDELSTLAQGLNDMARQLGEHIHRLRRQQNEQRAILQSMSNGVIALDLDQRLLLINSAAASMFGLDETTAKGRLIQELIREPRLHRFAEKALASGPAPAVEFELDNHPGTTLRVVSERLTDALDQPAGLLLILDDVTKERRYEALRSDFAANVSHELRTPITNIKGYVETLLEVGVGDEPQARRFLDIIRKNSARLAAIVQDVMSLSKLERPHAGGALERHQTRIGSVVRDVAAQFETPASEKGIRIITDVPDDLMANAHAQLLDQAIGNLVSNAVNYSPSDTTVRIEATSGEHGEIRIAVIDEGPGIAAEHLPRLFERFYRVDKARSRDLGGTGLGLALVKHIALVHGGRVTVDSKPGRGSTFTLVLPAE